MYICMCVCTYILCTIAEFQEFKYIYSINGFTYKYTYTFINYIRYNSLQYINSLVKLGMY
jgi:hypothetical protein